VFTPTKRRVEDLLNSPTRFDIPLYQRDFKWGKDEAREFIDDLASSADPDAAPLFLGTIILSAAKQQRTTIIDGQQRLTTILLLLVACRARAIALAHAELAQNILTKIAFVDSTTAEVSGPRLIASPSVRDLFNYIATAEWKGDFPAKVGKVWVRRQTKRLKPIYDYFSKVLEEYPRGKLSQFLRAVYGTTVITIEVESDVDALSIFERTNARGMELEISDLLKNHLFSKQVEDIQERWEQIADNAGGTLLRMLKYFYVARNGYILKSQLYRQLKAYTDRIGAGELTASLVGFSEFYRACKSPTDDAVREFFKSRELTELSGHEERCGAIVRSLQALNEFGVTQFCPVAYAAIECTCRVGGGNTKKHAVMLAETFEALERYHFINNAICDRVGNEVERLYADTCESLCQASEPEEVLKRLRGDLREKLASEEEFTERFCELSYSPGDVPLIAYLFDRLNNHGLHGSQRLAIYNPDSRLLKRNNNIEHFLPQKPKNGAVADGRAMEVVDNIGNLLVVSYRTNSKLGNASPREKVAKLKGPLAAEIQNNVYVKDFIEKYGPYADDWNRERIENRARDMARKAYREVWRVS